MILDENSVKKNSGQPEEAFSSGGLAQYNQPPETPAPDFEINVKAITCPQCGSPLTDGEVVCSYCQTGLLYELVSVGEPVKFNLPRQAKEVPRSAFFSEGLAGLAKEMYGLIQNTDGVVYVMVAEVPLVLSNQTTPEQAVKDYKKLRTHVERAELGFYWTDALKKYKALVDKIVQLGNDEKRTMIGKINAHYKDVRGFSEDDVAQIIMRPNITDVMRLADEFPGDDDAEKLEAFVNRFSGFLPT